ncbi:MAG: His/Gly/Thr/Pro-type tRNA ligase C-terminal domain-containing protein [Candidatus Paceibacterota bacterium]
MQKTPKTVSNAFVISKYYGFEGASIPEVTKEDKELADKIRKGSTYEHADMPSLEHKISLLKQHKDKDFEENDPVLMYCESTNKAGKTVAGEKNIQLQIIGTPKSIAEALLIKTTVCILQEEGYKDIGVEINNVGGKESLPNFIRELNNYYKKHVNDMDSDCRQLFKEGSHALVACGATLKSEIKQNSPSPLNYLNENNRSHFKEVIEYLDVEGIPYDVNKDILGNPNYSTNTVFTIVDKKTGHVLATGSRYNQLAKKAGHKKDLPGIGVTIKLSKAKQVPSSRLPKLANTKFFFIQIGSQAKFKSLQVLDMLRKAKIPVQQVITREKITNQIAKSKHLKSPYVLIMGQKEAIENSVLVRDVQSHSQTAVKIENLIDYLNNLK